MKDIEDRGVDKDQVRISGFTFGSREVIYIRLCFYGLFITVRCRCCVQMQARIEATVDNRVWGCISMCLLAHNDC